MKKLVILIMFVFMLSNVYAYSCYQEYANVSTSCGGLSTGRYNVNSFAGSGPWNNERYIYDGSWTTYGDTAGTASDLVVNYTVPPEAINATVMWKNGLYSVNYSIPHGCFNVSKPLSINMGSTTTLINLQCFNYTSNSYYVINTTYGNNDLYEEGIFWEINRYPIITAAGDASAYSLNTVTFNLTVVTNNSVNVYADLIYNGTNTGYTTRSIIDSNTTYITKSYTIPSTFGNSSGINYPWYWNITTISNTSTLTNQTVYTYTQGIDNCTNATQVLYNFTIYDESTRSVLTASNISTTMEAYLLSSTTGERIAISNTTGNKSNFRLCTYPGWLSTNITAILYLSITYDANGYYQESYNVHNFQISNTSTFGNVGLYILDESANNYAYRLNLKDSSLIYVENAIIEIYRKYPGTSQYLLTESPTTDTIGNAIAHLSVEDTDYRFIIKKTGATLETKNNIRVYETTTCNSVYSDCFVNLQLNPQNSIISNFNTYKGIMYNYSFDKVSKTATLLFRSADNINKDVEINITNYYSPYNQLCYSSSSSTYDTITCSVASSFNGTVNILTKVDGYVLFTDYRSLVASKPNNDITAFRYFIVALLLPIFVIMGYASIGISILLTIAGLALLVAAGFIDSNGYLGGGSLFLWSVVCLVFILIKAYLGGQKNG